MRWTPVAGVLAVALGVAPGATAQRHAPAEPSPAAAPREPCAEVVHAALFEDRRGAERAYGLCRSALAVPERIMSAEELRRLEDAAAAMHELRREDGRFCVEPAAPFDLTRVVRGALDSRSCLLALDQFLTSEETIARFLVNDPYAAGRLAARAAVDVRAARRSRHRPLAGGEAEREGVALARLAGRHFMRLCRCLPGPQPETVTALRRMHLPSTVEAVVLRGLADREEGGSAP